MVSNETILEILNVIQIRAELGIKNTNKDLYLQDISDLCNKLGEVYLSLKE